MSLRLDIPRFRRLVLLSAALLLSALGGFALGQGRRSVSIQGPSSPSATGSSTANRLGRGPESPSYGGNAGPLQVGRDALSVRRWAPRPMPSGEARALSVSRVAYRPLPGNPMAWSHRPPAAAPPMPAALAPVQPSDLEAVRRVPASCLAAKGEVNSLVPAQAGPFAAYMSQGQAALRDGDFVRAWGQFRLAGIVQPRLAEAPLGMALAKLGTAVCSYSSPAIHLQQALRLMPSLPRVRVRPAELVGGQDVYAQALARLERHVEANGDDAEALLALAMLRAFDGGRDESAALLARADQARRARLGDKRLNAERLDEDPLLAAVRAAREALGRSDE